jgi:hypothetical protein
VTGCPRVLGWLGGIVGRRHPWFRRLPCCSGTLQRGEIIRARPTRIQFLSPHRHLAKMAAAAQAPRRILLIPVDDTDDSEAALAWLLQAMHRDRDELHFIHVVLPFSDADFAAVYGVPPVDYIPTAAGEQQRRSSVAAAESWLYKRFVLGHLPADLAPRPVVHIVKVRGPASRPDGAPAHLMRSRISAHSQPRRCAGLGGG